MLGPNIIAFWFYLFTFKSLFTFCVIFFFLPYFKFHIYKFIVVSSSHSFHWLLIGFASLKYNQSLSGFDTWTSILIFIICDKIAALANLLTSFFMVMHMPITLTILETKELQFSNFLFLSLLVSLSIKSSLPKILYKI